MNKCIYIHKTRLHFGLQRCDGADEFCVALDHNVKKLASLLTLPEE